jgi:bla regulator protein blaR1
MRTMQTMFWIALVVGWTAAAAPVGAAKSASESSGRGKTRSSWHISDRDGQAKQWNGSWNGDGFEAKFRGKGEIRFARDLSDVEEISTGGFLMLEEQRGGRRHKADFWRQTDGGPLHRIYRVDGEQREWDAEARAWMARFLIEMDRGSGALAEQRFPGLWSEGGVAGVLEEISRIASDYAKSIYFHKLLDQSLVASDVTRAVAQAGREIESDYELARTLIHAVTKHTLANDAMADAFLDASRSISSDYEHARVLMVLATRPGLSRGQAAGVLESAARLGSDYERGRVLITMVQKGHVDPAEQPVLLRAVIGMKSDYEQGRVLRALVESESFAAAQVVPLLAATTSIRSDYERATVLVTVAHRVRLDDKARDAFIQSAEQMRSDYERKRALAALGVRSY